MNSISINILLNGLHALPAAIWHGGCAQPQGRLPLPRCLALLLVLAAGMASAAVPDCPIGEVVKPAIYRKGQTRIMPLGDSITHGGASGWRIHLQDLLRQGGYTFRMVGGRNDPRMSDRYGAAHGGWTIGSFPRSEEFGGADVDWVGSQPDVVLLEIGTNNAFPCCLQGCLPCRYLPPRN